MLIEVDNYYQICKDTKFERRDKIFYYNTCFYDWPY